jgi:hypothetical protein
MGGQVVLSYAEALPLIPVPPIKKGKRGAEDLKGTSAARATHSASIRGHRDGSAKVMADRVLENVEVRASDEPPLVVRQSFKDGRCSHSIGMEEIEW